MPIWLITLYLLHVGAAFYWLGSTFLVAQAKGKGAERQFPFQMLAAGLAMALGAALWGELHPYGIGKMEVVLAVGVACAIGAAGVQGVLVGGAIRKRKRGVLTEEAALARIRKGHRWAAVLLAVALLAMVGSYHV
jgi:divalent metal cation (Fe/Co/Zn/Cd) transporter